MLFERQYFPLAPSVIRETKIFPFGSQCFIREIKLFTSVTFLFERQRSFPLPLNVIRETKIFPLSLNVIRETRDKGKIFPFVSQCYSGDKDLPFVSQCYSGDKDLPFVSQCYSGDKDLPFVSQCYSRDKDLSLWISMFYSRNKALYLCHVFIRETKIFPFASQCYSRDNVSLQLPKLIERQRFFPLSRNVVRETFTVALRTRPGCGFCLCLTVYSVVRTRPVSAACSSTPTPCRASKRARKYRRVSCGKL